MLLLNPNLDVSTLRATFESEIISNRHQISCHVFIIFSEGYSHESKIYTAELMLNLRLYDTREFVLDEATFNFKNSPRSVY